MYNLPKNLRSLSLESDGTNHLTACADDSCHIGNGRLQRRRFRRPARPDGRTNSAWPFLNAWQKACGSRVPATIYVPPGRYYISEALFQGPCNNARLRIYIDGTLVAPAGHSDDIKWLTFKYVHGLSIFGGVLDGQGQRLWNCKLAGGSCPTGATSLTIGESSNVLISGVTSLNSKLVHMAIIGSSGVTVDGARITAPGNTPNTNGIHVQMSSGVTITGTTIKTGDDCISMGEGTSNVWIERVNCGPGHGISIGSLGENPQEEGVRNITVKSVVFSGTQNGLRIKTWGVPNRGSVSRVTFQHAVMKNVQNPILVDRNYCPGDKNCPYLNSGIRINKVYYSDIQGSSATPVAVKFDCSVSNPCRGMRLWNIKLTYGNRPAQSYCRNVHGAAAGLVIPPSCL